LSGLPFNDTSARPLWPELADMGERLELYDLANDDGRDFDFDGFSINLAAMPVHADTVKQLWGRLKAEVPKWL
jgi:hypothetical protein